MTNETTPCERIRSTWVAGLTRIEAGALEAFPTASATVITKEKLPVEVGIPLN
jgi:hypothetical protein